MLTGLIGNGLAILVAGVALLLAKFRHHVPGHKVVDEVLLTGSVLGMLFAGDLTASTGLGHWVTSLVQDFTHMLGHAGTVAAALLTLFVLLTTAVAVFRSASEGAMRGAFILPLLLAVFPTGLFHSISGDIQGPANFVASAIASHMGV